jgi:hypothetical protein
MEPLTTGSWIAVSIGYLIVGMLLFTLLHSTMEVKHIKAQPKFFAIAFMFFWPITAVVYIVLAIVVIIIGSILELIKVFKKP